MEATERAGSLAETRKRGDVDAQDLVGNNDREGIEKELRGWS